jgi:hypothetical protein
MLLENVLLRDTRANQPAATAVAEGTLYYVTDESVTEQSRGGSWVDYSDAGSGGSNINISAGTTSQNLTNFVLSNSNNVSFGLNGSTVTASVTVASTQGSINVSAGTTSNLLSAFTFSNSNNVSFGLNASTITASIATSLTAINLSAGTTSNNSSAFTFSNSNGVSFGLNAGTITASVAGGAAGSVSAGTTNVALGQVVFSNSNNVSFGLDGSTVTATVTVATSLTNIRVSAGTTSNLLSAITFSNANGVSFGLDASTVTASHNGLTSQSNQNVTAGNGGFAFQTLSFSNVNGISFGTSAGSAITASHNAITSQSNQQMTMFATGNTTQSSTGTTNASSLIFRGEGVASVGITNGSVVVSVPAGGGGITNINVSAGTTSQNLSNIVFSNSNGVSFGLNGSTITGSVNAGAANTISTYIPYHALSGTQVAGLGTNTTAVQFLIPFEVHVPVAAEYINVACSVSFITGGTSSFNQSGTLAWCIFTRPTGANSTRLSGASTGSLGYSVSYNNSTITINYPASTASNGYTTSSTSSAGFTGLKFFGLNLGATLTPGQYWLGMHNRMSSSSFNSGLRISLNGQQVNLNYAPLNAFSSGFSSGTNFVGAQNALFPLLGSYSSGAGQTALATDVTISQMTALTCLPFMRFETRV